MNYLVHLYLSGDDPELQLGGMMGDFVKGPIPAGYSEKIRLGLMLHRRIDSFSLTSRHCRNSRRRLHPRFGHVRSVMVDVFYDHFLAMEWSGYHSRPLEIFAEDFYRVLVACESLLPDRLARIAPRMIEHNWLVAYREKVAVERALRGLASRLSRPTPLAEGLEELYRHEDGLLNDFRGFMEEAQEYSGELLDCER